MTMTTPTLRDFPYPRRVFEAGDVRLAYIDEGEPTEGTLLLLHGSPMWSYMWRRPIATLRQRHRVIAVDLPGFGASAAPIANGRAFSTGANALRALIEALDLRDFTLIVHATSGPMGLAALLDAGAERASSLVITNSFAWSLVSAPGRLGRIARFVSSRFFAVVGVHTGLLGWITARFSRRGATYARHERHAIQTPLRRPSARAHLANVLRSLRGDAAFLTSLEHRISELSTIPSLVVYGKHDNGFRPGIGRWRRLLPHHQLVVLEDSGHFPTEDQPEAWTRVVHSFLATRVKKGCEARFAPASN